MNLAINDPGNPLELLENAKKFQAALASEPDKLAVPYTVTLAPTAIAQGPLPPNPAEIQHAQDVLIYCAKKRSDLLDKMNLLDFISSNEKRFVFGATSIDTVRDAVEKFQADLELIAQCAGAAINNRAAAKMPELYAAEVGREYPTASLPDPMPMPDTSLEQVKVPDFSACPSRQACEELAKANLLTVAFNPVGAAEPFKVVSSHPPKDAPVDVGAVVLIFHPPEPPAPTPTGPKVDASVLDVVFAQGFAIPQVQLVQ